MAKTFCLIPEKIAEFKKALKSKDLTIDELLKMSTEERIKTLKKYAGESAKDINLLFEQKLVLKNKMLGVTNLLSKITKSGKYSPESIAEIKSALKKFKDLNESRILNPKESEVFYNALADKLTGTEITRAESKHLFGLKATSDEAFTKYNTETSLWASPEARAEAGASKVLLENYIGDLKGDSRSVRQMLKDRGYQFKTEYKDGKSRAVASLIGDTIQEIADNSVAMVASVDNSFLGRQGLNTLMTRPSIWWDMAGKSFTDFYKTLKGQKADDALWAKIYTEPNYINGKYDIAGLFPRAEEQFPTSLPARIPVIGRVFGASENAFTGSALRARTQLFNLYDNIATKNGVDMTDNFQIKSIGTMVSSLTARGKWGKTGEPKIVRALMWAPKMLKANIDVLTGHIGQNISPFAKRQARINLGKIVATSAVIGVIANAISPGSAETDPLSSDFGKIKVGNTRFDFTGGKSQLITLAARLIMNETKSTITGETKKFGEGYKPETRFSTSLKFLTNKFNPVAGAIVNMMKGVDFKGDKVTTAGIITSMFTPITVQNVADSDNSLANTIGNMLDFVGVSSNTYSVKPPSLKSKLPSKNTLKPKLQSK